MTISKDSHCAQVDVEKSSIEGGLYIENIKRVEQLNVPSSAAVYEVEPKQTDDGSRARLLLLISNDDFKIKVLNADTSFVRKTCLGPGALYGVVTK
jgi:hypothetical protein